VLVEGGRNEGGSGLTPTMAIFLMYFVSDIVFMVVWIIGLGCIVMWD